MNKVMTAVSAGLVGLVLSGCSLTPEQGKAIAQNAGIYSAVIWIAVDNPSSNQMDAVRGILDVIKENASKVKAGQTFTEVIYPELVKVIDVKVQAKDRPLAKAASLTILNGLDTLFAMHPEWKASETLAIDITNAYVDGAKLGLSMGEKSVVIQQARATGRARAKLFIE